MPFNSYLSLQVEGLDANLPATPDHPELMQEYYATDTGYRYIWNTVTKAWDNESAYQTLAAAGQTQGTSTVIKGKFAIVTAVATATHNGVQLPTCATGKKVLVVSGVSGGFKVYPLVGGNTKIAGAATNAADSTNLASFKANLYVGVSKTTWSVQRGA